MQYLVLVVLLLLSLSMEGAEGSGVRRALVPALLDPRPTLQYLPCPVASTRVLGCTYRVCNPEPPPRLSTGTYVPLLCRQPCVVLRSAT